MDNARKNWKYAFLVVTVDRPYVLFVGSNEERLMWLSGFDYLLASTEEVQKIINQNEEREKEEAKFRTKEIKKEALRSISQ